MKKQAKSTSQKKTAAPLAADTFELKKIQLGFLQKFRQVFFYDVSLADPITGPTDQTLLFIKKAYVLLKDDGTKQYVKLYHSGDILKAEVTSTAPSGNPIVDRIDTGNAPILIAYKLSGTSVSAFLIVGTGDFRNIAGTAGAAAMQYIPIPDEGKGVITLACNLQFQLSIYS